MSFDPVCIDKGVLVYVCDGIPGYFGNISIGVGFIKYANVFVFPSVRDCGLVVAYMFYRRRREATYFADESENGECGNVAIYLCSV
jgi:hypothetical protein